MGGTGRFELPTPRTPSECSTRLSHVPTRKAAVLAGWGQFAAVNSTILLHHSEHSEDQRFFTTKSERLCSGYSASSHFGGGTNSFGSCDPWPKKYCSICSTRNCWASGFHGCRRYSFSSIFDCSAHIRHASALTFSKIFWPNGVPNARSPLPRHSFANFLHLIMHEHSKPPSFLYTHPYFLIRVSPIL